MTEFGGLDIVVANAGIAQPIRPSRRVDPKAFDRVLDVNLHGVVHTVRQALPHVIERRGHVLVIASVYAFLNGAMQSSYAMSKAAVEQLGRALRVELAPHGASAGVGYFGFVDTAMVRGAFEDPIAGADRGARAAAAAQADHPGRGRRGARRRDRAPRGADDPAASLGRPTRGCAGWSIPVSTSRRARHDVVAGGDRRRGAEGSEAS